MAAVDRFLLDEDGFAFRDERPAAMQRTIETFLDLLDEVERTGEVVAWEGVWDIQASSGRTLSTLLFERGGIDPDVRRRLGVRLDRLRKYDEALDPMLTSVCDDTVSGISPSISVCVSTLRQGRAAACLTTDQSGRRGSLAVGDGSAAPISTLFLVEAEQVRVFWRFVLDMERAPDVELHEAAGWAFPRLKFAPDIWAQIRRFAGPPETSRRLLLLNLAGLDDHALAVWQEEVQPHLIAAKMKAVASVDCSLDSPNTHGNASAMRERNVDFGNRVLVCEWHAKLERHQNRIHFKVLDGSVYVGLFTDHLTT